MRIGVVLPGFSASENDSCIPTLLGLVRDLAATHDVHVFTLRYPFSRSTYSVHGARVHALGGGQASGWKRLPLLGRALRAIAREHGRAPFDVFHAIWADEPGWVGVTAGRWLGVPALVSLLGGEMVGFPEIGYGSQLSRFNRGLIRRALSGAARVVVGSSYLARLVERRVSPDRIERLPIGVDTALFHPKSEKGAASPLAKGDVKLLHVASLVPVKDQATLLCALSLVTNEVPGAHLHVVGEGPLRGDLEAQARSLGLSDQLTFHGSVPHHRLPDYYRAADLCVMASRHEGHGWVTLEAAACGRATIGTAVGVLPDLQPVTHAVPVRDHEALAQAVVGFLREREGVGEKEDAARRRVEADYSLSITRERLSALYERVAHAC